MRSTRLGLAALAAVAAGLGSPIALSDSPSLWDPIPIPGLDLVKPSQRCRSKRGTHKQNARRAKKGRA